MINLDDPPYVVVIGNTSGEMTTEVSNLMSQGYIPHGSMSVVIRWTQIYNGNTEVQSYQYTQPMIRKDAIHG